MDKRVLKTKKNLYDALLHLMGEQAFESIKVSEICERAMTNRSTFYDHFEDKYSLLNDLLFDLKDKLKKELLKNEQITSSKEYYMECIRLLLAHIEENKKIYLPLMLNNKNGIAMDMVYSTLLEDITERMQREPQLKVLKIPADFLTTFYVGAIFQVGMKWIQATNYYSKEEILTFLDVLLSENLGI